MTRALSKFSEPPIYSCWSLIFWTLLSIVEKEVPGPWSFSATSDRAVKVFLDDLCEHMHAALPVVLVVLEEFECRHAQVAVVCHD